MAQVIWRKSSHSLGNTEECVEVAATGDAVGIRDSKSLAGSHPFVGRHGFRALVSRIKRTEQHSNQLAVTFA
ncbi:MAG: DUF397 domain-containing protein [Streptosporangiaceae bacterium]